MNVLTITNSDLKTGAVDFGLYQVFKYLGKIRIVGHGPDYRKVKGDTFYLERLSVNKKALEAVTSKALGTL